MPTSRGALSVPHLDTVEVLLGLPVQYRRESYSWSWQRRWGCKIGISLRSPRRARGLRGHRPAVNHSHRQTACRPKMYEQNTRDRRPDSETGYRSPRETGPSHLHPEPGVQGLGSICSHKSQRTRSILHSAPWNYKRHLISSTEVGGEASSLTPVYIPQYQDFHRLWKISVARSQNTDTFCWRIEEWIRRRNRSWGKAWTSSIPESR